MNLKINLTIQPYLSAKPETGGSKAGPPGLDEKEFWQLFLQDYPINDPPDKKDYRDKQGWKHVQNLEFFYV